MSKVTAVAAATTHTPVKTYEDAIAKWALFDEDLVENLVGRGHLLRDLKTHAGYIYEKFIGDVHLTPYGAKQLIALADYPDLAKLAWRSPRQLLTAAGHFANRAAEGRAPKLEAPIEILRPSSQGENKAVRVAPKNMTNYEIETFFLPLIRDPKALPEPAHEEPKTLTDSFRCQCPRCGEQFTIIDRRPEDTK